MKTKIMKCVLAATISIVLLAATVFATESSVDWGRGIIRATGIGSYKKGETNPGLQRAQAKRAATIDAQRTLAECVMGVQVTSESSLKDLSLEYDVVKTRIDTIIKGMSESSVKYFDDGTCEVVYEMPMYGSNRALAAAAFLPFEDHEKVPFPEPTPIADEENNSIVNGAATNNYTGLVIDCRGKKLNPVMSPVIRNNEGRSIYGFENLDIDKVIELGMASYTLTPNDEISRERAGNNPLVVKAVKLEKFNSNPVVSVDDANKILIANQTDQFLDNCAVVFVR